MLKPSLSMIVKLSLIAAAFGRLCVETDGGDNSMLFIEAAAFGRLCVETSVLYNSLKLLKAAAFGRLCVETTLLKKLNANDFAAAFGRLCVETLTKGDKKENSPQPPSGGCVLKHLSKHWYWIVTM